MQKLQTSEQLFQEYRSLAYGGVTIYSRRKAASPTREFPRYAALVWRYATLAEMWGVIATKLSTNGTDYLKNWRTGV